jgi:acetylornithine deacetylase
MLADVELKELAARLVRFNTVSRESPLPMADFVSEYLERCGFSIERYPYESGGVKKVNLLARKGGPESRLVLSGHMDTVPAGSQWASNPFELTPGTVVSEKREVPVFTGLGISDMKLFVALAMKAGEAVSPSELGHPFAICLTSDEEVGCLGAKKLVEELARGGRPVGRYVVIGEPTGFVPIYAHKGYIHLEVMVGVFTDSHGRGKADNPAHSSDPGTTTNAVERALPAVIDELLRIKTHLEGILDPRFRPPCATMNIGGDLRIGRARRGGNTVPDKVAKNIIPRGFTIECDIRPLPEQDPADLIDIIRSNIEARIRGIRPTVPNESFTVSVGAKTAFTHPMLTPPESPIVRLAEEVSGNPAGTVPFNTEGHIFNRSGSETVVFGPTDIRQAHADNEHVRAELLEEASVDTYVRLIRRACAGGEEG